MKAPTNPKQDCPGLLELFFVFAGISVVTIGGGYVMFPLLQRRVVDVKGWLSLEEMADYYALGQSVPGIIAINTSTLIGYKKRGVLGACVSAMGMALPSLVIIVLIAVAFTQYFDAIWVQKAFAGIRAAVVAMIAIAVWRMSQASVNSPLKVVILIASFLGIILFHASPAFMIVLGALLGFLLFQKKEAE